MDPWDSRQLLRDFLQLLPLLAVFILGGLFALAVALAAVKRARKKWDADFLSRYKEEHRSELQERDVYISDLKAQLKDAQATIQWQAEMRKAAITMSSKLSEILATAASIPTSRRG